MLVESSNDKTWKFAASIAVTILLATGGYLYTWLHDRQTAEYEARLNRINLQLRDLYGPLYALAEAEERSFQHFLRQTRPDKGMAFWDTADPPTEDQQAAWRRWIREVTMPNYLEMERIILRHADLYVEDEIPSPIMDLAAHISGYKPVIAAWAEGDFSRNWSFFTFPQEVRAYLSGRYQYLKQEQRHLLGLVERAPNKALHSDR